MSKLLAGAAREIITPPVGGRLYGYRPDVYSKEVHDDLTVTAVALESDGVRALLISITVCLLNTDLATNLRKAVGKATNIPWRHVIVSATHTHSGPCTAGETGWGEIDTEFCDQILFPKTIKAAKIAVSSLRLALLGVADGESRVGINRRELTIHNKVTLGQNPWGCFDPTMTVLALREPDGKPIVNMIHYGAHCTACGLNHEITRDWAGPMIDRLEAETNALTCFFNGAEGDVGPRLTNGRTVGNLAYAMELGGVAALDAVSIYRRIREYRDASLVVKTDQVRLPYKPILDLETAQREYDRLHRQDAVNITLRTITYYKNIIDAYQSGLPKDTHFTYEQTVLAIGPVVFLPFPFEFFSEISLRLRKASPFPHTLCLGCTNGDQGYLPTEDQLCRGGYEIEMFKTSGVQTLTDDADYHIIAEHRRILEELKCTE
ncbi:MAG TPA: hypothetical protein GX701_04180 [Clostridiales bacterium]|jgi:neutral ceramidase|nr:hypothetical protein [Clostridiales bacterium]